MPKKIPSRRPRKPPYRVPPMTEIARLRGRSGLRLASTFSGCGGSCLGFEMAGFEVLWASEFVPAAREVYELNHPGVPVDARDVRDVRASDVLGAVGLRRGELDVLEGSPPCASFSTAGRRDKKWGEVSKYSDTRQRTDDLFFEFARLLKGIGPRAFVAENVSGLVKGVAKGYFKEILRELKGCGYRVSARVLDAQWLGVPQARQRLIFVGFREDLGIEPAHPAPLRHRYSVADACPWIVKQGDNGGFGGGTMRDTKDHPSPTISATPQTGNGRFPPSVVEQGYSTFGTVASFRSVKNNPSSTIGATPQSGNGRSPPSVLKTTDEHGKTEKRKLTIAELRRICGFPDDFRLTGTYAQRWERLGRAVPPPMMRAVAEVVRDRLLALDGGGA